MQYYIPDNNKKGKRAGVIASFAYLVLLLIFFLFGYITPNKEVEAQGILIDFGTTEDGAGETKTALADNITTPAASATAPSTDKQPVATQEIEEAPEVKQQEPKPTPNPVKAEDPQPTPDPTPNPSITSETEPQQQAEKPREIPKRTLFPGRSTTSTDQTQGSGSNSGNSGNPAGGDEGKSDGNGDKDSGVSFSLDGRKLIGSLPKPAYPSENREGKVIIDIVVDSKGNVTSATFQPQGSTLQEHSFINAARNAAMKARFDLSEGNDIQSGNITYIFKLK